MLYFLQPLGLLAAAGIIFPVIIHLWNKKEGKTLKIGSVQLLVETARQQARSLRLKDLWLLLLRCLIIFFLALLLAKPVWQKQLIVSDQKGWVVLDNHAKDGYQQYKTFVDSLLRSGFEAHQLSAGFPLVDLTDTTQPKNSDTLPYWSLLKALNEQVPDRLPVYLITNNRLDQFRGNRPAVSMNLHWLTYEAMDTLSSNIVAARLLSNDSIETYLANSTPAFTAIKSATRSVNEAKNIHSSIPIDTSTVRVAIMEDPANNDASYIEAAILAIRQSGRYRIQLETVTEPARLTNHYDWVFWLSQKVLPETLASENVMLYGKGKEKQAASTIELPGVVEKIALRKMIANDSSAATETVWQNGFGEPVLTKEKGARNMYRFYSRFNPAWNDLVWSESFPTILFVLMLQKEIRNNKDKRSIDVAQILPTTVTAGPEAGKPKFTTVTNLSNWAWSIAFLLFALERFISLRTKKEAHA